MTDLLFSQVLLFGSNEGSLHLPEGLSKALIGFHSGWRYIILIVLILAIVFGYQTSKGKKPFLGGTQKAGFFTMLAVDIQFVVGAILYFFFIAGQTNFKIGKLTDQLGSPMFRTIALDHAVLMFIALIFIHIGYSKAKKARNVVDAGKKQFVWMLIALILILIGIPWPFLHHERGWV